MDTIGEVLNGFQSLPAVAAILRLDLLTKLALATLLGGVIGWEREASGKPAGLRTNILICVGATVFTEMSISPVVSGVAGMSWDASRVPAQIVSGIGFLGAGTIMQAKGNVTGLTTAATLWVVAAIGMTVGAGAFFEASGTTLLVLAVLWPLGWVEDRIEESRRSRTMRVVFTDSPGKAEEIQRVLEDAGLKVRLESLAKGREGEAQATFEVGGSSRVFRAARAEVVELPEVNGVYRV